MPRRNEKLWRCSCGGSHFVSITHAFEGIDLYPDDEDVLSIESCCCAQSLWDRIKGAWQVLRGNNHCWAEVILDYEQSVEICEAMKEVINRHIEAMKKSPPEKMNVVPHG